MGNVTSHLMVVAIGHYENDETLEYIPKEGRLLVDALTDAQQSFRPSTVDLVDTRDNVVAISAAVTTWTKAIEKSDRLVLVWAGHGRTGPSGHYLVTSASPPREDAFVGDGDFYDPLVLARQIFAAGVSHALLVVDSCYSGAALGDITAEFDRVRRATTVAPGQRRGVAVISTAWALSTVPEGASIAALRKLLADESAPNRSWSDDTQWIDLHDLIRSLRDELDGVANPDGAAFETAKSLWTHTDGKKWVANPRYIGARPPELVELLRTELAAVTTADDHFDLAARGIDVGSTSWLFTGRERTLQRVTEFLRDANHGVMVVTGPPGVGKSAVVGRVVTMSVPGYRDLARAAGGLEPASMHTMPEEGAFDVAVHARSKTSTYVARSIARAMGFTDLDREDLRSRELLDRITERGITATIAVDALDEAQRGHAASIAALCRKLAEVAGVRVLIGCRYHLDGAPPRADEPRHSALHEAFGPEAQIVDIDDDPENLHDYSRYVHKRLGGSHHAGDSRLEPMAELVSQRALAGDGHFLYVRLVTRTLEGLDTLNHELPESALGAFHDDLLSRFGTDAPRIDELLSALAWGFGGGLSAAAWARCATALSPTEATYHVRDVNWALDTAGWHVIQAVDDGQTVYRLAHDLLADFYRRDHDAAHVHSQIFNALSDGVNASGWLEVDAYTARSIADHATQAGELGQLVSDPWFLAIADPQNLLRHLRRESLTGLAAEVSAIYRRVATDLGSRPPDERLGLLHRTALQELDLDRYGSFVEGLSPPDDAPWRVDWIAWRPSTAHEIIASGMGQSIVSVARLKGRDVVVISTSTGAFVWDAGLSEMSRIGPQHRDDEYHEPGSTFVAQRNGTDVLVTVTDHGIFVRESVDDDDILIPGTDDDDTLDPYWIPDPGTDDPPGFVRVRTNPLADGFLDAQETYVLADGNDRSVIATGHLDINDVIAIGQPDGTIRILDHNREQLDAYREHSLAVTAVAIGEIDGRDVVVSGSVDETVRLWDRSERSALPPLDGHVSSVTSVAVGRLDGRDLIVSGSWDGTVRLWDITLRDVGNPLLLDSADRALKVGAVAAGRIEHYDEVSDVLEHFDVIVSGSRDGRVRVTYPAGERATTTFDGNGAPITSVAVRQCDEDAVVVAGDKDGNVWVWDPWGGRPSVALTDGRWAIRSVAIIDAQTVATCSDDHARVWDLSVDNESSITIEPKYDDDDYIDVDTALQYWDGESDEPDELLLAWDFEEFQVTSVIELPYGGLLIGTSFGNVEQWTDDRDGRWTLERTVSASPTDPVTAIASLYVARRRVVVAGHESGSILVSGLPDEPGPIELHMTGAVVAVAGGWLGGSPIVAAAAGGTAAVWSLQSEPQLIATIPVGAECSDLAIDESGRIVVSSPRGMIRFAVRMPDVEAPLPE